ncbi:MAG: hypothetical protein K5907_00135 [Treponema sp.]|nr:hypothetical protein [Treponema sp.]
MKKSFLAAGLLLSALLLFSCATTQKTAAANPDNNTNLDEELPFVSKPCTDNEIINVYQRGKIKEKYDELPPSFTDAIVFECESEYYYNNKTNTSVYEMIYVGVQLLDGINTAEPLERGTQFANSTAAELKIICRTKDIDTYLVSSSNMLPKKYEGHYYYLPGMLLNTTMKYLDFASIEEYSYEWLYHHTVEEDPDDTDWAPGASFVRWNAYIKTELALYPQLLEKPFYYSGVPMESSTVIEYKGIPFELYFQPGFKQYLEEECKPGDQVYFYVFVDSCNYFSKSYTAYVRDFSTVSPEEIIDERIQMIKARESE